MRAIIGEELARKSAISFERFMELALYCPKFGYYERPDVSPGQGGDYFTSVSVGSLFGELLAGQFAEWLETMPDAAKQIAEAGAHHGQLAVDILGWLKVNRREVFETVEYWIVEPSVQRKKIQEQKLAGFAGKVRWFENWEALPEDVVQGVIFSNELLDAIPVRRLGWDAAQQKWFEWGVAAQGNDLVWTKMQADGDCQPETASWSPPPELLQVLPDGFTTEVGEAAQSWWRQAARALKQGKLLAFDYGLTQEEFFTPERKDGTLRAYHRHHLTGDLLAQPGELDITSQVNFTAIREAGEAEGLKTERFVTQALFLTGIVEAMSEKYPSYSEWLASHSRAFQTLTHPEHLGRSFRVLWQER